MLFNAENSSFISIYRKMMQMCHLKLKNGAKTIKNVVSQEQQQQQQQEEQQQQEQLANY